MKKIIPSILLTLTLSTLAEDTKPTPETNKVATETATDFIRVHHTATNAYLQTGITRYTKGNTNVDLIGAVHIADKSYFDSLNKEFQKYQAVLFEMVGGENLKNGKLPKNEAANKEESLGFLGAAYNMMQTTFDLTGQKEHINYAAQNFVHADLSIKEFTDLQKKKGESIIGFALAQSQNFKGEQPSTASLLHSILSGNPNKLKLSLVDTLGGGDDKVGALAGKSVIIGDRNHKALLVMDQQIKAGKTNLSIFYGAAHFPDMEKRLLKLGYKKTTHRWLNAWAIDKQKANPKKAAPKPKSKKAA